MLRSPFQLKVMAVGILAKPMSRRFQGIMLLLCSKN
jgi:hypothetical protein